MDLITFTNLDSRYQPNMDCFLAFHGLANLSASISVTVSSQKGSGLRIEKQGGQVHLTLDTPSRVFRALTLLKPHLYDAEYTFEETCYFQTGGPMFDGSQATSLLRVDKAKEMMLILAGMGFNMMMLYCEDCYEIPGEPYFGNMRPRYTAADFKELDDYADSLGIELIPCIQTLGHLPEAIKKLPYRNLADNENVLLVGDAEVYALIDKMLAAVSGCFRSRRIHIGMDEAWGLGRGRYLERNPYTPAAELMRTHLQHITPIIQKYGLEPMMWGDMFFRSKSASADYYDPAVTLTPEDRQGIPEQMGLIYWDYYATDSSHYEMFLEKTAMLSDHVIFAGCARNVRTFGTHYHKGKAATDAAMQACKNKGVREFIATVWGDDHRESSNFAILPQLQRFAEHMYCMQPDDSWITQRFESCTGLRHSDMMDIDLLDAVPGYTDDNKNNVPLSKLLMWQNILLGLFDYDLHTFDFSAHYHMLEERFSRHVKTYPQYALLFAFYEKVAAVLKRKAGIGRALAAAYRADDRRQLQWLLDEELKPLFTAMQQLREAHRAHFYDEYKPIGWEILDIRYGGAIFGVDTAISRVSAYLDGQISRIEELEEERLSFDGAQLMPWKDYRSICSASRV